MLLAATGLLDGREATSHWGYQDLFRRQFPDVRIRLEPNLVFADRAGRIVTAGDTTSWHDLAIHIIARHCSPGEALRIAKGLRWRDVADYLSGVGMAKLVKEETMQKLDRRSVLVLGAVAAAPLAATSAAVASERYAADEGTELLPGVRQVDLSESQAMIPGYATVSMRDIIIEPGAEIVPFPMENDMVCHMLEGELEVVQDGAPFTASEGQVWTCAVGTEEGGRNATGRVAIMRITDLFK